MTIHRLWFQALLAVIPACCQRVSAIIQRAVVQNPVITKMGIKLGSETRGKETIAEQTTRCIDDENMELRFGDGITMRARIFRQPANHHVHVFDVVYARAIRMTKAVV